MKTVLMIGALIGATFLAYRHTLSAPFIYDDKQIIVKNPLIRKLDQIPLLLGASYWGMNIGEPKGSKGGLYRPLTMLTYAINYRLGNLNPHGYHWANLLLHIATSLLLWLLCLRLGSSPFVAGAAAILFALLPIHTEAVSNIVGRSEVLSAFFVLLSWILATGASSWGQVTVGAVFFLLALFSKENSAAFWPVLIFSDLALRQNSWKELAKERMHVWVIFGAALFLYLEWRYLILGSIADMGAYPYFTIQNVMQIVLSMAKFTLAHYLRPLILGTGFCAEFTRPDLADPGLQEMTAWVCTFMLFGVIGYALYSALIQRDRMAWCVLLFFGLLFPVSNLLIHLEVIGAERFLYLPSIGYGIALGLLLESIFRSQKSWAYAVLIGLCLWYGWGAFERNKAWETEESFWKTTLHDAPGSPRSWNGFGMVLMNQGKFDEALAHFQKALALNPMLSDAYYNMAECYFMKGDMRLAKNRFLALDAIKPYDRDTLLYLAVLYEKALDFRSAASYYAKILALNPLDRTAERNLALMHCRMGNLRRCRDELHLYLEHALPEERNQDIQTFLRSLPPR